MARPDPVLDMFKLQNFMPLLLPQQGIGPMQLVMMSGKDLTPLGEIATSLIAPAGTVLPPVISDIATAASLEGMRSSQIKLSIGLEILGNILQALTGTSLNVAAAYSKAKTITFKFSDVSADKIEINKLDQYLGKASIHPDGKHIETMMIEDKVGVLTMTLKSKKFIVSAKDENGFDLKADVPVIQGIAGGKLEVKAGNTSGTEVAYEGTVPITFAAQGIQLFFDDSGHYTAFDPFKVGQHAVRGEETSGRDTSNFAPAMLTIEGGFARLGSQAAATAGGRGD